MNVSPASFQIAASTEKYSVKESTVLGKPLLRPEFSPDLPLHAAENVLPAHFFIKVFFGTAGAAA